MKSCEYPGCKVKDLQYGLFTGPKGEDSCAEHYRKLWALYRLAQYEKLSRALERKPTKYAKRRKAK